jgi:hypothetical protein
VEFDAQYWLGIDVESKGELAPRYKLTSAGYAINTARLDGQNATYYLSWTNLTDMPLGFEDGIDDVGAGESRLEIALDNVQISSPTASIHFDSNNFNVWENPSNEANVSITTAPYSVLAGTAAYAASVGTATYAVNAGTAAYTATVGTANYALTAGTAAYAVTVGTANYAVNAGTANYAVTANNANYSNTSGTATYAINAGTAAYASMVGTANYALTAGTATYAVLAGTSVYSVAAGTATYAVNAGTAVYAAEAGRISDTTNLAILTATQTFSGENTFTQKINVSEIESNSDINLSPIFGGDVNLQANIGLTFGNGEKIEGDDTDLTLESGADIYLTAANDVRLPNNVGMILGDPGEKIEGDGTDLTIDSSNLLNINATETQISGLASISVNNLSANDSMLEFALNDSPVTNEYFITMSTGSGFVYRFDTAGNAYCDGMWMPGGADFAEWFAKEGDLEPRDLIGLNLATGKVRKYREGDVFLGIYSEKPGFLGGSNGQLINELKNTHAMVGLMGQLNVAADQIDNIDNKIYTKDGKLIGYLLNNGRVFINSNVSEIIKLKETINSQQQQINELYNEIELLKNK